MTGMRCVCTRLMVALGIGLSLTPLARAQAQSTEAPARPAHVQTIAVGEVQLTSILDGQRPISAKAALRNIGEADLQRLQARHGEADDVETSFNAFLLRFGSRLVLVDAGAGRLFGAELGKAVDNLRAAGIDPSQISSILLTHMHVDHVGGLVAEGRAVFPNATVFASKAEGDFWLSESAMQAAPSAMQPFFRNAMAALAPYRSDGRFKTFLPGEEVVPGVRSLPLPGHSPGHSGYLVESQGQTLLLWGDIVHLGGVQLARPATGFRADVDVDGAAKTRMDLLAKLVQSNALVAGAHLPFPGVGRLATEEGGYAWRPLRTDETARQTSK